MSPTSPLRSLTLLALVACLVVSPVAALQYADSGPADVVADVDGSDGQERVVPATNTSNYLEPEPGTNNRQEVGYSGVDVAAAVDISSQELESQHQQLTFEHSLRNARPGAGQTAVIRTELADVDREITQLRTAQREVLAGYASGSVSTDGLLRRIARIDAAADGKAARLERVRTAVDSIGAPSDFHTQRYNLQGNLLGLGGPASARVSEALTARGPATEAYISVSGDSGLVVSTVDNGWLYREAFDGTELGTDGPDRFASEGNQVSNAYQRAADLYPWAYENTIAAPPRGGYGNTSLYYVRLEHVHGDMEVHLDGRTENVFHEIQQKRVADIPVTTTAENVNETLAISVNGTGASGPMAVSVTRPDTGNPADATIRLDGVRVGTTGTDGRLVTVQPAPPYTVTATTDNGESVEITIDS